MFAEIYRDARVLITGHTGFKGSWLLMWLSLLGARICGYALPPPAGPSMFGRLGLAELAARSVMGDILDARTLQEVCDDFQPEIVFHLAAQPLVRRSYREPLLTYQTNVIGTLQVLEAARRCGTVRAFVNVTSDKCYENTERREGYREDERLGGHDPYSSSKACSELLSASYRRSFLQEGYALATARAGNVIGGGDFAEDRLIPDCMRALSSSGVIALRHPQAIRPWQHVLEPLSGYLLLGCRLLTQGQEFARAFNFGPEPGAALTVAELTSLIISIFGRGEIRVAGGEAQLHEAGMLQLSTDLAERLLHWHPQWDIRTAAEMTARWYHHFYAADQDMRQYTAEQIRAYEEHMNYEH